MTIEDNTWYHIYKQDASYHVQYAYLSSHFGHYYPIQADGVQYLVNQYDGRCYRQEGDKVYTRESKLLYINGQSTNWDEDYMFDEEYLLFDFSLGVGDSFTFFEDCPMVVEHVTDTLLTFMTMEDSPSQKRRCLHLRGVNNPGITDVWIEGIGSAYYGIIVPESPQDIARCRMMFRDVAEYEAFVSPFHFDDAYGVDANVNENLEGDREEFTATVDADSIYISGYYYSTCGKQLYCLSRTNDNMIWLSFYEYGGPEADCMENHYVKFSTPRLTEDIRGIYVWEDITQEMLEVEIITSSITAVETTNATPYYDLQGRRVIHPTRGLYIRNGRKVIVK